ncbi:MAG: citramalate synthase [Desulfobacterales bacterium]|nr:citramalate synthase [Desulfobacterales bacterium]
MNEVLIYDTTLRDGTQGENISFTAEEKIKIAKKLDDLGIHYIEGGWPISNIRDKLFFQLAKDIEFKNAKITAFCSTRKPNINVEDDKNIAASIESGAEAVAIFGKTWDLHVKEIMNNSLEENLNMINDSVSFLKSHGKEVIYDAEHFFDGYKDNREYALETIMTALSAGSDYVVFCDTNGGTLPNEVEAIVKEILEDLEQRDFNPKIGIHAHNDCSLAVANSIAAVRSGAIMVHGTINGYGERCGNADLTSVIPVLSLKMNLNCISKENLAKLRKVSRFVSETANMVPQNNRPFVGKSAFAHKGGIHVSAVMKQPRAYEHMNPELVGNDRRILVSDLAGKSNILYKAKELGIDITGNGFESGAIVSQIKMLEQDGYQFDIADGSLKILMEKMTGNFTPAFELVSFRVNIEKDKDFECYSHATIKVRVGNEVEITAAEGHGPVSALDNALRKALVKFYTKALDSTHLVDFKVRVMDGRDGTSAKVRVLIDSRDEDRTWSTIGVSEDIIEASWQALADSIQYKLSIDKK